MDIGLYSTTHGVGYRDDVNFFVRSVPAEQQRPVEVAQLAERVGFHSMWFADHVCMPLLSASAHVANASGQRAYESRHNMLDVVVTMSVIAAGTTTLRLGPSVLIAPYRNLLSDARQFATFDLLSGGRLIFGVGAGWMKEEFDALGLSFHKRGPMTNECIEIYKRAWTRDVVDFRGSYYNFERLSMDPKPAQKPRPPIIFGGVVPAGARRAARLCDGFYPIFLDTHADPARYSALQDEIRREGEARRRDLSKFHMMAVASARITGPNDRLASAKPRPILTGTPEQVLSDLQRFADQGYWLVVIIFDALGRVEELEEQIQRFGEDVIPAARGIKARGGWSPIALAMD
jgi:probable F420-dependent oxidoreductase